MKNITRLILRYHVDRFVLEKVFAWRKLSRARGVINFQRVIISAYRITIIFW